MFEAYCAERLQRNLTLGQLFVLQHGQTTVDLGFLSLQQHGTAHGSSGHHKLAAAGVDLLVGGGGGRLSLACRQADGLHRTVVYAVHACHTARVVNLVGVDIDAHGLAVLLALLAADALALVDTGLEE